MLPKKRSMCKTAADPFPRSFLLPLLFLTCLSACARTEEITIYATARGRGWLWSRPAEAGKKSGQAGGYAVLKNLYALDKGPKLAVDLGNWFGETPEGYLTKGLSVAECMNAVGYSIAAAGPEDLTLPPSELEKLVRASSFPVLASNLYLRNNRKPSFIKSQHIETVGGARIGFLAVTVMTPEKFGVQRYRPTYKLEKESYEIERSLRALKEAGAGLTVILMGINPKKRTEKDFYGAFFRKLPHIDLVITDDPGLKKPLKAGRTWIVPVPGRLTAAARIRLGLDPETRRLVRVKAETVPLEKARYGEDLAVLGTVNRQRGAVSRIFSRRLGSAAADMPRQEGQASPLGNFTADCIRRWARSDAAVVNNSVLGGDILKGPVTAGDLHRAIAAETSVVFVKIRGEDLKSAIETISGNVSVSGMEVRMRGASVEGLTIGGEPVRPGRIYHLAVPDSIVNDKDYSLLASATEFANSKRPLREVVGWCISRRTVTPKPDSGRITRAD